MSSDNSNPILRRLGVAGVGGGLPPHAIDRVSELLGHFRRIYIRISSTLCFHGPPEGAERLLAPYFPPALLY